MTTLDVLIISTAHHHEDGRLVRHKNCFERNGYTAGIHTISFSSRFARFILGPIRARKFIIAQKPHCILIPDPELQLLLLPMIRGQCAVISDIHEDYHLVKSDRLWIRAWIKPAVGLILKVLEYTRRRLSHTVIAAAPHIKVKADFIVTNKPNIRDLPNPTLSTNSSEVVYVGDIRESRGVEKMLDLLEEIQEITLHLVGPVKIPGLQKQIQDKGLSDRVILHGRLNYFESWTIASKCIAGLSLLSDTPAFRYSVPTKVWEYWTVGIPVLATDIPGQANEIKEVRGGAVGDYKFLCESLRQWIQEPEIPKNLGSSGRNYIESQVETQDQILCSALMKTFQNFGNQEI